MHCSTGSSQPGRRYVAFVFDVSGTLTKYNLTRITIRLASGVGGFTNVLHLSPPKG